MDDIAPERITDAKRFTECLLAEAGLDAAQVEKAAIPLAAYAIASSDDVTSADTRRGTNGGFNQIRWTPGELDRVFGCQVVALHLLGRWNEGTTPFSEEARAATSVLALLAQALHQNAMTALIGIGFILCGLSRRDVVALAHSLGIYGLRFRHPALDPNLKDTALNGEVVSRCAGALLDRLKDALENAVKERRGPRGRRVLDSHPATPAQCKTIDALLRKAVEIPDLSDAGRSDAERAHHEEKMRLVAILDPNQFGRMVGRIVADEALARFRKEKYMVPIFEGGAAEPPKPGGGALSNEMDDEIVVAAVTRELKKIRARRQSGHLTSLRVASAFGTASVVDVDRTTAAPTECVIDLRPGTTSIIIEATNADGPGYLATMPVRYGPQGEIARWRAALRLEGGHDLEVVVDPWDGEGSGAQARVLYTRPEREIQAEWVRSESAMHPPLLALVARAGSHVSPDLAAAVSAHITSCRRCAALAKLARNAGGLLDGIGEGAFGIAGPLRMPGSALMFDVGAGSEKPPLLSARGVSVSFEALGGGLRMRCWSRSARDRGAAVMVLLSQGEEVRVLDVRLPESETRGVLAVSRMVEEGDGVFGAQAAVVVVVNPKPAAPDGPADLVDPSGRTAPEEHLS